MHPSEADELALYLRRCFRTMTDEQMKAIARNLEMYDRAPAFEAIQRHVGKFEFVNGAALFAEIQDLNAVQNRIDRKTQAARAVDDRRQKIEEEQHAVEANMCNVFASVQSLSPEVRERHKAAIICELEKSKPFVAERLRDKDPQTSPMLASLIARRIGGIP